MARPRRGAVVVGLLIGTLLGPWGCTTKPYRIPPLNEQVRAEIGTLGVATSNVVTTSDLGSYTGGKGSGAAKGAGLAARVMGQAAAQSGHPFVAIPVFAVTPLAVAGGAIYGAIVARPAGKVKEAETTLASAFTDLKIHEAIHDRVLEAAQGRIGHPVVSLRDAREVDTILEISVPAIKLKGAALDIDPDLQLVVLACPRLIRRADGRELYPAESPAPALVHMSASRKFLEWAGEDARLFREEMEHAYQNLADQVVEDIFLGFRPEGPRWRVGAPAPGPVCPRANGEPKR